MTTRSGSNRAGPLLRAAAIAALLFGASHGAAAADGAAPGADRHKAHAAFERKEYVLALALYQRAAADGDLLAAERAGEMLLQGEAAFGSGVPMDLDRAGVLLQRAACAGSASAAALLDELKALQEALACGNA